MIWIGILLILSAFPPPPELQMNNPNESLPNDIEPMKKSKPIPK